LAARIEIVFSGDTSPDNPRIEAALRRVYRDVPGSCRFWLFHRAERGHSVVEATWQQPGSTLRCDLREQAARVLRRLSVATPRATGRVHGADPHRRRDAPAQAAGLRLRVRWEPLRPPGWEVCESSIAKFFSLATTNGNGNGFHAIKEFDLDMEWLGDRRGWRCTRVWTNDSDLPPNFQNAVNHFLPSLRDLGSP
jgi:hypothetical protein